MDNNTLGEFVFIVDQYSNKNVEAKLIRSDVIKGVQKSLSWDKILKFEDQFRDYYPEDDTAVLYLMCLPSFAEGPSNIGVTFKHDGIIIFNDTIQDIVGQSETLAVRLLQLSTMVHEFGHQLGLDHMGAEHCVMNEKFETPSLNSLLYINEMPSDFCPESVAEIERIKNRK